MAGQIEVAIDTNEVGNGELNWNRHITHGSKVCMTRLLNTMPVASVL
jgi:hypothetical protein